MSDLHHYRPSPGDRRDLKPRPSLSELWESWRRDQRESEEWKAKVGYYNPKQTAPLPVDKINTYYELLNEPQL